MLKIRESEIHGHGVHTTQDIQEGEIVYPVVVKAIQSNWGRYTNHDFEPNIEPVLEGRNVYARAMRDIEKDEELVMNYEDLLAAFDFMPSLAKEVRFYEKSEIPEETIIRYQSKYDKENA